MEEQSLLFHIGPIWFDGTVAIMLALVCAIIFLIVFICTRSAIKANWETELY